MMANYCDSIDTEKLKALIANKKNYLRKVTNKTSYQLLQKEILFLENEILPVVQADTDLLYNEYKKYAIRAFGAAIQYNCNGLLLYSPISDNYDTRPLVGVVNARSLMMGDPGAIEVFVDNMDLGGYTVKPVNLPLDAML